ncbi:MAG: hypothetical protein GX774_01760 [Armatimonadetes bacterium]|nr:hypothetical protein [Armatimonadota bacterium]
MLCPKCHAELNRDARFCWQCGAPAAAPETGTASPSARRAVPWMALAAGILVVLAVVALLIARRGLPGAGPVTTGDATVPGSQALSPTAPVTGTPAEPPSTEQPLTAAPPDASSSGQPVTATPPGSFPTAPGLPQGSAENAPAGAEEVAAYLRKLEAIQRRDSDNPMAQLFALMASGLSGLTQIARELGGEEVSPATDPAQYLRTFDQLAREKQALANDFQAITPVPQACGNLHALYGRYLQLQAQAILDLRSAVAQADNLAAPLAALPAGRNAEAAQRAAQAEEEAIRQRYGIPRTPAPLVP